MAGPKGIGVYAIATVPLLIAGSLFGFVLMGNDDCGLSGTTNGSSVSIDPALVPETEIAGYGREQLVNAAYIIQAGKDLGLNVRDQTIGVMTAMGESGLRNIDYGDWETGGVTNPDGTRTTSIGLFQQQDGWGTREERLDPYTSATKFFQAMVRKVPDRESQEPTQVAHRTQLNANPYHYTPYWAAAIQAVEGLSGARTGLSPNQPIQACGQSNLVPGEVNAQGWASPGSGPVTSQYGWRQDPFTGEADFTYGTDIGAGCGNPIRSVTSGVVTGQGFDSQGNGYINIDHGSGVTSRYLHMYESGFRVRVGDRVNGGDQIADVGSSGRSTGCHIHIEMAVNGKNIDPQAFLGNVGVTLGQ